jgi:primosomal replication protein N
VIGQAGLDIDTASGLGATRNMDSNRLLLQAQLIERGALRYTPAGLPALDMRLQHESVVAQDGQNRKVSLELRAKAVGPITQALAALGMGSSCVFTGFLGSMRQGKGIVFHVTEFKPVAG